MDPKTLPTIWDTYMKLVTKYQISAINSWWEKCDEKCAYMFNVYTNQLGLQTGSRNLIGPKTLPTIWYTYITLVTIYQISTINSNWEKCDENILDGRKHERTDWRTDWRKEGRTGGRTDRPTEVKQHTPSPSEGGGIIYKNRSSTNNIHIWYIQYFWITLYNRVLLFGLGLWCLTPFSTICQLYRGCQLLYWWKKLLCPQKTTDPSQVTNEL
jgi:hypothetical protein